jgi:hypothetical protein
MCVVETQIHKSRVERLAPTLGFDKSFAVSSAGRSGGLGLYWKKNISMEILPFSQYHIDVIVKEGGKAHGGSRWCMVMRKWVNVTKLGRC